MISATNGYVHLKYPLIIFAILSTILPVVLLLSYLSNSWFTYELFVAQNHTTGLTRFVFEYGSVGLWHLCIRHPDEPWEKCDPWIRQTRPEQFLFILIIVTCVLFLSNLMVFPSWIAVILAFYNQFNRYISYMIGLSWLLTFFSSVITVLLITVLILLTTSKMYSPGIFSLDDRYMAFHAGFAYHALTHGK